MLITAACHFWQCCGSTGGDVLLQHRNRTRGFVVPVLLRGRVLHVASFQVLLHGDPTTTVVWPRRPLGGRRRVEASCDREWILQKPRCPFQFFEIVILTHNNNNNKARMAWSASWNVCRRERHIHTQPRHGM
jgi:hypothetical protein